MTTNQQIHCTTTAVKGQTNVTMAAWMFRASTSDIVVIAFRENELNAFNISHWSDQNIYSTVSNGTSNGFCNVLKTNKTGWHHFCLVFDGSQPTNAERLKIYYDGEQQTLTFGTGSNVPSSTSSSTDIETFRVGRSAADNAWSNGRFAEIGIWRSSLSSQQANSLAKGFAPAQVSPSTLEFYLPLVRDIVEPVSGTSMTNVNTTVSDHPRSYA